MIRMTVLRSAAAPPRAAGARRGLRLGLLVLALCAACSNYDFARARTADGEFDIPMLMRDLAASGESTLIQWTWIPLIYLDMTTFSRADAILAGAFRLNDATSFGPLFLIGSGAATLIDGDGKVVERNDADWYGLSLWQSIDRRVETVSGTRHEDRNQGLFGLLSWEHVHYEPAPAK